MTDAWKPLGEVAKTIVQKIGEPTWFEVPLAPELTDALTAYSKRVGQKPETIIAEATRAYLGAGA